MAYKKRKDTDPSNSEEHREILAKIILHDMSTKQLKEKVLEQIINSYKVSQVKFLNDYWEYFDETDGHCPFGINGD